MYCVPAGLRRGAENDRGASGHQTTYLQVRLRLAYHHLNFAWQVFIHAGLCQVDEGAIRLLGQVSNGSRGGLENQKGTQLGTRVQK